MALSSHPPIARRRRATTNPLLAHTRNHHRLSDQSGSRNRRGSGRSPIADTSCVSYSNCIRWSSVDSTGCITVQGCSHISIASALATANGVPCLTWTVEAALERRLGARLGHAERLSQSDRGLDRRMRLATNEGEVTPRTAQSFPAQLRSTKWRVQSHGGPAFRRAALPRISHWPILAVVRRPENRPHRVQRFPSPLG